MARSRADIPAVADPQDKLDIPGLPSDGGGRPRDPIGPRRPFLSIWFRCCHTYGRLYRNRAETHYEGRCPRCGALVSARIGPDGTSQRFFEAW